MSKVAVVVVDHKNVVGQIVFVVDNVLAGSCLVFFVAMTVDGVVVDHVVFVVDNLFADVAVHQENDDLTMSAISGGTLVDGDNVIGR